MMFSLSDLSIPEFEPHLRTARNQHCKDLNVNNIVAEILGGELAAGAEVLGSFRGANILIEGDYSIVLRYKRDRDNKVYPAMVMGFDIDENQTIIIRHIQGTKQRKVSFQFGSGFDSLGFFAKLIEQNFTKKGFRVELPTVPTNLEGAADPQRSFDMYEQLRVKLSNLNERLNTSS